MGWAGLNYNPALESIVAKARATSCEDWLTHCGHIGQMMRSGHTLAGPCPKCGGTDRFGVDTAQDKWVCRGCGVGGTDAISMVVLLWDLKATDAGKRFIEAVELITGESREQAFDAEELARRNRELEKKKAAQADFAERKRRESMAAAFKLWQRGRPAGRHIAQYHEIRGIPFDVSRLLTVREIDDLEYWHDMAPKGSKRPDMQILHRGPAMLCVVLDSAGKFAGVHRTWLDPNGKKGKAVIIKPGPDPEALDSKKMLGSLADGAIRMVTPRDAAGNITATRMVIGEGYETSMTPAAFEAREDTAYWCAVSLGHLAGRSGRDPETNRPVKDIPDMADPRAFVVPDWVRELVLLADGDSNPVATKAAMTCAARRAKWRRPDSITVRVAWPGNGVDWNDLVMKEEGSKT